VKLTIEVDQAQLQRIKNNLGPDLYTAALHDLMTEAGETGARTAESAIDGGTGIAVRSIMADIKPVSAEVFSVMSRRSRIMSIEEGRSPGETIPLLAAVNWLRGSISRRESVSRQEWEQAKAVQQAIRAGGARAKKFLAKTREVVSQKLPGMLNGMARKIEGKWGGG
jgi:chromosome condensin MukBEF complex kleisin-like MukF subunit